MKKELQKKEKQSNKKIIVEIVLIPLCIFYLIYILFQNNPKTSLIICSIASVITCSLLMIKYLKEVYIYQYKYNWLKILFCVFSIILIIVTIVNLLYNIKILFVAMVIVLLCFLLWFAIRNVILISKNKKNNSQNIIYAFLSLVSFVTILSTVTIMIN